MRRAARLLFNASAAVSLLLFLAVCVLWARSKIGLRGDVRHRIGRLDRDNAGSAFHARGDPLERRSAGGGTGSQRHRSRRDDRGADHEHGRVSVHV